MIPFLHVPSRDANDADHLAIMLAVGGLVTLFNLDRFTDLTRTFWLPLSVIAIVSAPLLWIRVPHAKWGGSIAALLLGAPLVPDVLAGKLDLRTGFMLVACAVIAYWFAIIDYDHRFE